MAVYEVCMCEKSSAKVAGSTKPSTLFPDVMGAESGKEFDDALAKFPSVILRFRLFLDAKRTP